VSATRCLGGLDARLEGGHHVDDLRLLGLDGRELELFAGGLLADQVEDLDPVVVLVLVRLELGGERDLASTFDRNLRQPQPDPLARSLPRARRDFVDEWTTREVALSLARQQSPRAASCGHQGATRSHLTEVDRCCEYRRAGDHPRSRTLA
jgi:hypothetical protein